MPRMQIEWIEGRTKEQQDEVARRITQVFVDVINAEPMSVSISFRENSSDNMYRGGKSLTVIRKEKQAK
jgi:4-oxalocrotonate tautomerase family enzyme